MGMDLTLAIDANGSMTSGQHRWFLAYTRIELCRNYRVFGQIDPSHGDAPPAHMVVCKPKLLPDDVNFQWYNDGGVEARKEDPYGDPLTYVTAGELAKVNLGETGEWNKAVFEMIKALPKEIVIVLWWH